MFPIYSLHHVTIVSEPIWVLCDEAAGLYKTVVSRPRRTVQTLNVGGGRHMMLVMLMVVMMMVMMTSRRRV